MAEFLETLSGFLRLKGKGDPQAYPGSSPLSDHLPQGRLSISFQCFNPLSFEVCYGLGLGIAKPACGRPHTPDVH